jgi:dTMP kinase
VSASPPPSPARFIAIEGLDGSGGTTQTTLLAASLRERGLQVLVTREPSDGPVGQLIRAVLRGRSIGVEGGPFLDAGVLGDTVLPYLFAADRRDHLDRVILPALREGAWVLTDRYFHSSLAYQSLALPFALVAELNAPFPDPDLTVMLDLPPACCLDRILARGGARERFETLERLESVASNYERALDWAARRGAAILRMDASLPPETLRDRILGSLR